MAISPLIIPESTVDFPAPPPSPIASGRRSYVNNEEFLSDFLQNSLRVPDLVLPDKIFPQHHIIESPCKVDFRLLISEESESLSKILDSISSIGCFQLVNYGVAEEFVTAAVSAAAGVFKVSPEKKKAVIRSPEKLYGFEEVHGEEESESSEEFVWCRDENLKMEMEGIWPTGYSNFSEKMETLLREMEKVAKKILQILLENLQGKSTNGNEMIHGEDMVRSICYLYKHIQKKPDEQWLSSMKYDVIRMLIRGTDHSHALCLHLCDGSSDFHVYSKKGWVSFCPHKDALIVTIGDQIKALSGGKYKNVIGRPIFRGEKKECISMAFLCSPSIPTKTTTSTSNMENTISLGQQAFVALLFILLYPFLLYFYKKL